MLLIQFFKRGGFQLTRPERDPRILQLEFLRMVFKNLKEKGRLYLGIENRYDYQYFLWKKDQHSNLMYTAFLPREISNVISNMWYGRPYVNYLYSKDKLEKLLQDAGFTGIETYAAFPDYKFPKKIIPLRNGNDSSYEPVYTTGGSKNRLKIIAKKGRKYPDLIIYKRLKLFNLCPSFIVIASKK